MAGAFGFLTFTQCGERRRQVVACLILKRGRMDDFAAGGK
jgi:hypothetical protein